MRSTIKRAFIFTAGVAFALNLTTGTASAEQPDTPVVVSSNPSDAKFECSDSHHSNTGHGANNDDGYQSTCDPADFGGNGQEFGPGNQTGKPCAGCVGNADDKNPPGQFPDGSDDNSGYECDGRDRPFVNQNGNGNHGIGDENPAHTGCESTTETEEPEPDPDPTCPDGSPMTDVDGNGIVNAADCNVVVDEDEDPEPTCPDGSPMTDVDGNGIVNAADCNVVVDEDDTPTPDVDPEPTVDASSGQQPPVVAPAVVTPAPESTPLAAAVSASLPTSRPAEVLGVQVVRAPASQPALATTGTGTDMLVGVGGVLLLLGALLVITSRKRVIA